MNVEQLNIETKTDNAAKLLQLQGFPSNEYIKNSEFNEVVDKTNELVEKSNQQDEAIAQLSDAGGKIYNSLAQVIALNPKPANGIAFQVSAELDAENAGYYFFDSTAPSGVRFDRKFPVDVLEEVHSVNLFNKAAVIEGYYIKTADGILATLAGNAVSDWIPVTGGQNYYLSGRNIGLTVDNMRFKNAAGQFLKPLNTSGVAHANFSPGRINGLFPAPPTAVAVQFQVKWSGVGGYDDIQFEQGNSATAYVPYSVTDVIKQENLPPNVVLENDLAPLSQAISVKNVYELYKQGNDYKVRYPFNATKDIVTSFSTALDENGALNFVESYLINKADTILTTTTRLQGTGNDDACPVFVNGVYIGANHGAPQLRIITAMSHGKTVNDVGSVWNDGTNDYVLLKIVDNNNLWFFPENRNADDKDWDFPNMAGNTLTHVSGAINTGNINSTTKTASQLKPAMKNITHNFIADGRLITADGYYRCAELKIYETYDINDVASMLEVLKNNQPVGGYTTQPDLLQGDVIITVKNTYEAVKGGFIVYSDLIPRKACNFNFYGIVQSRYIQPGWISDYKRYIPHTTVVNDGADDWDFRLAPSILTPYAAGFNFTEELWENAIAPVRAVDIITDGTTTVNFNLGYLPAGASADRESAVNNGWFLHTTRKNYPNFITGDKINDITVTELGANQVFSGAAYRVYTAPEAGETNTLFIKHGNNGYLTGDFHNTGYFRFTVPDNLIGKAITVINKSDGVEILGNILQGTLDVVVGSLTNGYAYFEIKAL